MRNNLNSIWTEALTADLIRLWSHGYSCAQIGALIGCTRNAVIGKASRLKLPTHTRCSNVNGKKRAVNPKPLNPPRISKPRSKPIVLKSPERKPKTDRSDERKRVLAMFEASGTPKTSPSYRKHLPKLPEMTKTEMRTMLTTAVQNTAALAQPV